MELNQIILNDHLLTELYSSFLIEEDQVINKDFGIAEPLINMDIVYDDPFEFKHLGTNAKNILIVVHYPETAFLPDDHLNFLTKIISACKLSLADVAIINHHHYYGKTFEEITAHFKCNKVLFFAISPKEFGMPIQFPFYQIQSFNKSTFLSSPSLDELLNNASEKRKLWDCMKSIFSI